MRIVIDLQGAQSESRFRGVGRYSLALALAIARNAGTHEVWLLLNGGLHASLDDLRLAFSGLVAPERMVVFDALTPVASAEAGNAARARSSELLREHVIAQIRPDVVLLTSLFEGYVDDSVTSVGTLNGAVKTAVILYDLIPLLQPEAYLPTKLQQDYYYRKLESLRRAGLLLSISDYSRLEAFDALMLDAGQIVSISTAVDAKFHPAQLGSQELAALRQQFNITRDVILYAPGGFDARKNIDRLITAFSQLPAAMRVRHQLIIASKMGEHDRRFLLRHARDCGLHLDDLILTGYVSDATLIDLYRTCALFVFPSLHEGFGLPALEAMACGALVIGADNTSIPEVIACSEALFDASSAASIAAKMAEVLSDPSMQKRLKENGQRQAALFSWDVTAQRALSALCALAERAALSLPVPALRAAPHLTGCTGSKPKLAFVSPLPPERTGIADYAVQLLPALAQHFDIDLIVHQSMVTVPPELAMLPQRSTTWFTQHAAEFPHIIYQFGNSPFHSHMFSLLQRFPGLVVLHDFFLSSVLAYEQRSGAMPDAWLHAAFNSHGYDALHQVQTPGGMEAAQHRYPCNLAVLQRASRVIVHSQHAQTLARAWYGPEAADNWSIVPLPRSAPPQLDRRAARAALGLADTAFIVCSFGFIAPTKLARELLLAWMASTLHQDQECILLFVGANDGGTYGEELATLIATAGKRIRIVGWTDETTYRLYLQAADAAVQLRAVSRGETSAAVLDSMNYGLPTIVNANGSMAALPDDSVLKLPDHFELRELSVALEMLHSNGALRTTLSNCARTLLNVEHDPAYCARQYAHALALAAHEADGGTPALIQALAALPEMEHDDDLRKRVSRAAAHAPNPLLPRQLLVDVTTIARHDLRTGIERVVRSQLLELLKLHVPGWRVEPVYLSQQGGEWHYRYARKYTCDLLGIDSDAFFDSLADIRQGDQFYGADFAPDAVIHAAGAGIYANWRRRGVGVNFVLYDLLPVLQPRFFPDGSAEQHAAWLKTIAAEADRVICISTAVATEMHAWLQLGQPEQRQAVRARLFALHLGADISEPAISPASTRSPQYPLLEQFSAGPTFLMVGTIEPRKGHLQTLAAFDLLWQRGVQATLVIVGNEGWRPLEESARRTIPEIVRCLEEHPQAGKQLFWLKGIDDHYLQNVYRHSTCLLVPSEGEGFGLPLIEAAHVGLPMIVRELPVFVEVAGKHAYYFKGLEPDSLAEAVQHWLDLYEAGNIPNPVGLPSLTWRENAQALLTMLDIHGVGV